jgi:uncharacterized repeat protein (TIGR03803 family)
MSPSGSVTTLYSFADSPNDGQGPQELVQGSDGNFYGTTVGGGTSTNCDGFGCGIVFRITPEGTLTALHDFNGADGSHLYAGVVQGSDSNFYGTTLEGGTNSCSCGTVFEITPEGTLTTLHDFTGGSGGAYPSYKTLVLGTDGNFFGVTGNARNTHGNVFEITPEGTLITLHSFTSDVNLPGGLVQGSDGNLYGTTQGGGTSKNCSEFGGGCGTVYKLSVGQGCVYGLSPKSVKIKASGGPSIVKVIPNFSDCDWTAVSHDPFITITAGDSGLGKGTVSYTVAGNTNTVALVGTMTIAGRIFTVDQAGIPCAVSLEATNANFSAAGGSSNVMVTANGTNCAWKAAVSGSFIEITSDTSGTGDGTVDYTVAANTKTAARKGTITVGKEKLAITQSGAP